MSTTLFVWLGSGRARRRRVGDKGMLLDQAAHARLPVPAGAILLDEFYRVCLEKGLVETLDGDVIIRDPELLCNTLFHSVRLPHFERPVAIRSAFQTNENSFGGFPVWLNVDANDAEEMSMALAAAWTAAYHHQTVTRADILIMEMVIAGKKGTALTTTGGREDVYDVFIRPENVKSTGSLPQLNGWQTPGDDLQPFARRLQMLLRGVRRTFGIGKWQIEWADDGHVCQLLQVSNLTATHDQS